MARAIGVGETELGRVLARQEGNDARTGYVGTEVDDEMPEVVLLLHAHGAVGEEDERAGARQAAYRVVGVDPRVHARARFQLRPGRPQLRRDDRRPAAQLLDQEAHVRGVRGVRRVRRVTKEVLEVPKEVLEVLEVPKVLEVLEVRPKVTVPKPLY